MVWVKAKLQAELGVSKDKAEELFSIYHERVPFVKSLTRSVSNRAQQRGQIRTLLGRLCRFHLWEPNSFGMHKALPFDQGMHSELLILVLVVSSQNIPIATRLRYKEGSNQWT